MPKLNQIVAIEKTTKNTAHQKLTDVHHQLQKQTLLAGIARSYKPRDEEGEQLPPESTKVQVKAQDIIAELSTELIKLFDITATKDWGNTKASADVKVKNDGGTEITLLSGVPIVYLLFLEKQLIDLHTFIKKLPVLDPGETWEFDAASDCYATPVTQTMRTKKVPRNHVKAEATEKHPAQVDVYHEDITVGTWHTTKFSGALPAKRVNQLLARVERLQEAVKFAREEANALEVTPVKVGNLVTTFLFS